jgi:hypothetical protein
MLCGDNNPRKRILTVEHSVKGGFEPVSVADHREFETTDTSSTCNNDSLFTPLGLQSAQHRHL